MVHGSIRNRELTERAHWLVRLRWFACGGVGVTLLIARAIHIPYPLFPQVVLLLSLVAANSLFAIKCRQLARERANSARWFRLAHIQIAVDLFLLTLQIHFAGGIENPFKIFYIFHIILASILLSRSSTYLFAAIGSLLYTTIIVGEAYHVFHHYHLLQPVSSNYYCAPEVVIGKVIVLIGALFFTSYMATSITHRLREREDELSDLTEQLRERSGHLEQANRALQQASEERTRFLRIVEHELRSPLAAIQSCLQTVLSGYAGKLDEAAMDLVSRAAARSSGLLELVQNLLALTKSEYLTQHPGDESVDIQAILEDEVELHRPLAEKKNLHLHLSLESTVPVMGLSDMVQKVFANLISNAIRYTPKDGDIRVSCATQDRSVIVTVQDNGIGMTLKEQTHLFEEFFRSERAKNIVPEGAGLGMAFVKRVVDSMSGAIEVESEPGHGTTLRVILPAL